MDKIKQNSPVLFYFNHSKKWLMKISKKESLHTHIGVIKHSDAIGKEYGSKLITNKDKYVYLLRPTMYDYVMKIQHGTQIVYPKDLGYIVARSGIGSGQKILEIGTGSGSLTSFIANIVKPRGHVYTFDVNENFMKIAEKNIKIIISGNLQKLSEKTQNKILEIEQKTKDNSALTLNVAFSYGARQEIVDASKKIALAVSENQISLDEIDESFFVKNLYKNIPDPELLIRTAGDIRLSNFLLWQLAYSELYFTKTFWPDFNKKELILAIEDFNKRERRYGKR